VVAVADDQGVPVLVTLRLGGFEVGFYLGLQRLGEHLSGPLAGDLVEVERELLLTDELIAVYSLHRCILPADVGASALPFDYTKGRYTTCFRKSPIHNFRAYLPEEAGRRVYALCYGSEREDLAMQSFLDGLVRSTKTVMTRVELGGTLFLVAVVGVLLTSRKEDEKS
jgi:hypothetical protein